MRQAIMAAIAAFLSIPLWMAGNAISNVIGVWDFSATFLYKPYNRLMICSAEIESWDDVEIMWKSVK